jgi:hypothetical protein
VNLATAVRNPGNIGIDDQQDRMSNSARCRAALVAMRVDLLRSQKITGRGASVRLALAVGIAVMVGLGALSADARAIPGIPARVVAIKIPGVSAVAQIGTFRNAVAQGACAAPIPT